ncbi:MAG: DUF975 family protein [Lachnospiraceae bacterium]|nr:DUF975 family protein [Lachnospiraceae bacterium]
MKKIRDMKALARESLLDKYGTVIGAYFLSGVLVSISALLAVFNIVAALANTRRFEPVAQKFIPSFKAVPALSVVGAVFFTAFLVFTVILSYWLRFGRKKLLLNICRGEKYGCSDIFYAFKGGTHPWRVIGVNIVGTIFVNVNFLIPTFLSWAAKVSGYDEKNPDPQSPWFIAILVVNIITLLWVIWLSIGFTFADTVILDKPDTGVLEALKESLHITRFKKLKLFWMVTFSFIFWYLLMWLCRIASLWVLPYIETTMVVFYLCAMGEEFVIPANRPATADQTVPEAPTGTAPVAAATEEVPETAPAAYVAEEVPETAPEAPVAETAAEPATAEPVPAIGETPAASEEDKATLAETETVAETVPEALEEEISPAPCMTEAADVPGEEEISMAEGPAVIPAVPLDGEAPGPEEDRPAADTEPAPVQTSASSGVQTGEEIIITEDEV